MLKLGEMQTAVRRLHRCPRRCPTPWRSMRSPDSIPATRSLAVSSARRSLRSGLIPVSKGHWSSKHLLNRKYSAVSKGVFNDDVTADMLREFHPAHDQRLKWAEASNGVETPIGFANVDDYPALKGIEANPVRIRELLESAVSAEFQMEFRALGPVDVMCLVTCSIPLLRTVIKVSGKGDSEANAKHVAFTYLVSELHNRRLLKAIFDHKASLADLKGIYDYAARFLCVPIFQFRMVRDSLQSDGYNFEVTISLEEQSLSVTTTANSFDEAVKRAIHDFNKKRAIFSVINSTKQTCSDSIAAWEVEGFIDFYEFSKSLRNCVRVKVDKQPISPEKSAYIASIYVRNELIPEPVIAFEDRQVRKIANLAAAITLIRQDPSLWDVYYRKYARRRKKLSMNRNVVEEMKFLSKNLNYSRRKMVDRVQNIEPSNLKGELRFGNVLHSDLEQRSHQLRDHLSWLEEQQSPHPRTLSRRLPVYRYKTDIIRMVDQNDYSFITGAFGSGKSTQVPQILFDHAIMQGTGALCNIFVSKDRLSTVKGNAGRVALERSQTLGSTVGYGDSFGPKLPTLAGSISYYTHEMLLDLLSDESNGIFETASHVIIDDVEKRTISTDLLLAYVKSKVSERANQGKPVPKLIVMGLDFDVELFASYFRVQPSREDFACPSVRIQTNDHPADKVYLNSILEQLRSVRGYHSLLAEPQTARYLSLENIEVARPLPYEEGLRMSEENSPINGEQDIIPGSLWEEGLRLNDDNSHISGEQESIPDSWWEEVLQTSKENLFINEGQEIMRDSWWEDGLQLSEDNSPVNGEQDIVPHLQEEVPPTPIGLVAAAIDHIAQTTETGAILALLPDQDDIERVNQLLVRMIENDTSNRGKYRIFKHSPDKSGGSSADDRTSRTIILSTGTAGFSLAESVCFVVDAGFMTEKLHHPRSSTTSQVRRWIYKSWLQDRVMLASHKENGKYYALFSKEREASLQPHSTPHIRRLEFDRACLHAKVLFPSSGSISDILSGLIEPPSREHIFEMTRKLQALNLIDQWDRLTPLGRIVSSLPLSPTAGKLVVLGVIFRCLEPLLISAAAVDLTSDKASIFDRRRAHTESAQGPFFQFIRDSVSDHIGVINAFKYTNEQWNKHGESKAQLACRSKFIRYPMFLKIWESVLRVEEMLFDAGIIPNPSRSNVIGGHALNMNSTSQSLIKSLLLRALLPNIAEREQRGIWNTATTSEIQALPGTALRNISLRVNGVAIFSSLLTSGRSGNVYLDTATLIPSMMACLFAENLKQNENMLYLYPWLQYSLPEDHPFDIRQSSSRVFSTCKSFLDEFINLAVKDLAAYKLRRAVCFYRGGLKGESRDVSPKRRRLLYRFPYMNDRVSKTFVSALHKVFDGSMGAVRGDTRVAPRWPSGDISKDPATNSETDCCIDF
ncbi:Helicase associated domain family protein [Coccidioides posadasii C735 delta SOWgp]|uniref:Helicase associated domain family protein n=1 Tax=Coccidioides posadasii (strain C735) TaxID=222929 RepID=C5P3Q7_COCP7|nr:Helicase associated domain family protein [Coccidioides posadasii C735 delta SOWgp]EER28325.1 Helicase associated domain family protein [Coccidioides posadasii C735 delta SOWgp]|eukprot:XP_003070470.1 Helicase associated domain family protein [Coccidioides posadasii C735 delta SOWgp]